MPSLDRTTDLFVVSVRAALPDARIQVQRSRNQFGRSHYVFIDAGGKGWPAKVRISDHALGMRRATSGSESLYLSAGARPDQWAVWLGDFVRRNAGAQTLTGSVPRAAMCDVRPLDPPPPGQCYRRL